MTTPEHHSSHVPPARPSSDGSDGAWTVERIRALGPVTDLATAARIFGLSRSVAYDLAKRGQFPVAVLRFGSRYRVPVAAILHTLHLPAAADDPEPGADLVQVARDADGFLLSLALPLARRDELDLARSGDELVVTVGGHRRVLALPSALRRCTVAGAVLVADRLEVRFRPDPDLWPEHLLGGLR